MDFNLDVRLKQLESLEQYISSSRDKVQSILDCLKWNTKEVTKESQLINCRIDPTHRVSLKNVDEHSKNCSLRKAGYDVNEDFLSEPLHDVNSSIIIDHDKKVEILTAAQQTTPGFVLGWNGKDPDPKTANRLCCTFSACERSALYSYAVTKTVGPPKLPEFNTVQSTKSSDKPLTVEELRMQERDAKRRRIKYKSVHTNRKSQKEILKEVIDGQMELYKDWLVANGVTEEKLEQSNEFNLKSEDVLNCEQQSSQSSTSDMYVRGHSVVSKNSTQSAHSGSSKDASVKSYHKDKYEHNHYRRHDDYEYKRHSSRTYDNSYSRHRSRERYEGHKHRRSRSRHNYDSRSRYDDSRVR